MQGSKKKKEKEIEKKQIETKQEMEEGQQQNKL